ncbi:Outer membrane protein HopP [Helicobacter bizzozeronii]|nr:Outer membrane protein HopP [Helicobacter bizzozeronii]
MMRWLVFIVLGLLQPLGALKNHVFTGVRFGYVGGFESTFSQQVSMSNPSTMPNSSQPVCPKSLCKGDEITGFYKTSPKKSAGFAFTYTVGDEIFFDKFAISGLRVYGTLEYANANLGSRYKVQNKGGQNYNPQYIKAIDPTTGNAIPETITGNNSSSLKTIPGTNLGVPTNYTSSCAPLSANNPLGLCPTPNPQAVLLNTPAHFMTFGLNVDVFLNVPLDYWLKRIYTKMFFFKMGVFVGGGVEYAILWSDVFKNEVLGALGYNPKTRFFAAGGGFFVNVGYQLYLGKHNRINIGWKFPYYKITANNWYNYGNHNPGTQQTLKQTLSTTRRDEFYVSYAYLF